MTAQADTNTNENREYFNDKVAKQLAGQLGDGVAPTQKAEVPNQPYNPATGRAFHGINGLNLMMQGKSDDRWLTWDEAKQAGLSIKKGEKPTPVQYWPKKREGEENRRAITTWVYNGEQLLGMPPMPRKPDRPDPMERVLDILKNSGATIVNDREHRGYYSAKADEIHLPNPDKVGKQQFCEDAIYQYMKSAGHPSRLNRETFDSPSAGKQAHEELICTVATLTMCAELGIPPQPARNADLVESWQQSLSDHGLGFARDMNMADQAVWVTLQQEHAHNKELNPQEAEVWRPVAQEFPHGAVKTFLDRKDILDAIEKEPEKLDKFMVGEKEVFARQESGYILSKKALEPDNPESGTTLLIKTEGFDREGNPHDILMSYNIQLDSNGLAERTSPAVAHSVKETEKAMTLPQDWSGKLEVQGCRENADGGIETSNTPQFYSVFAKTESGQQEHVASFDRQRDAMKFVYQVERNYEYLGKQRGLDIDFDKMKSPDQSFSSPQKERIDASTARDGTSSGKSQAPREVEPSEQTRAECIAAMEAVGMIVSGNHPIFDGKGHRIDVEGDKKNQNTGWYVAHADGRPAGTCVNNRTNTRADWSKTKGYTLSEGKKRELNGIAQAKNTTYQKEQKVTNEQAKTRLASMMKNVFTKPNEPTPYLASKDLPLDSGIFQNKGSTCIPIHDVEGTVHSMAYVKEDGTKRYAKGGEKEGNFYAYGGMDALKKADAIIICEGYATAASVSMASGMPTVAAFDSGNIGTVAEKLHKAFPDKPIVIAADDDRHLPDKSPPEKNAGKEAATKAAEKVNGTAVFPRWAATTPADKQFKDFDDIRRVHGVESVRSQIMPAVERAVERAKENKQKEQEQEKTRNSLSRS